MIYQIKLINLIKKKYLNEIVMGKDKYIHPTRIFKTPEDLEKAWNEFKKDVKDQGKEWVETVYVGKDGTERKNNKKVPLTYVGFKRFCHNNYGSVGHYFDNKEGYYAEFGDICSRIKDEIRENQIIGGLLNFYNPSITQRLNNLVDKKESTVKAQINIPNLPDIGNRK